MSDTSKTLLFGGSGFLGPIILEKYPDIVSVGRTAPPEYCRNRHVDLRDLEDLRALDSIDFDKVIFLIGNSNHHEINLHPTMGFDYNVLPLKKILAYFKKRPIAKLIFFTTILLYDQTKLKLPVGETQPIDPYVNEYVFSKYISEEIARLYKPYVPTIAVRFSNIYGPSKLIRPDLVPTLIQKCLSPNPVSVWSKEPVRDWLYLDDAAEAIVKLLDTDYTGVVNLGSGSKASVGEIASILERLSGKTVEDLHKPVSGPMDFQCDISLVRSLTGWTPKHDLEQGITETYQRMSAWADECRWWEHKDNSL